jgi:PST family polysaccharide transporter
VIFLVLLTRLLRPEDFGLFGMVAVFLGFGALLADQTLGPAVAQRLTVTSAHLDSVFWYSVLSGGALSAAFYLLAPALAAFYGVPHLDVFARALSVLFLVNSLSVVPRAVLQRRVAVDRLARIDFMAALSAGTVAVALALAGRGAWSLVAQAGTLGVVTVAGLWWSSRWRPGVEVRWESFRELLPYGANVLGSNVSEYWARNADSLLIGRLVGTLGLGLYSRAYTFVFMPVTQVNMLIGKVLFPMMCSVQRDVERARQVYLRAVSFLALIVAPMLAGLFVTATALILTLFGREWIGMVPVLRILAAAGGLQVFYLFGSIIYSSHGRTDLLLRWGIRNSLVLIAGISVGAAFGTVAAVAWGFLAANVVVIGPAINAPGRLLGIRFGDVARAASPPVLCAVAMGVIAWGAGQLVPGGAPSWIRLVAQIATGIGVYLALLIHTRIAIFGEFVGLLLGEQRGAAVVTFLRAGAVTGSSSQRTS